MSADPRAITNEALGNLREAGQRPRGVQNRMRADGLCESVDYGDLDLRVSNALAVVEATYTEAQRLLKRLKGGDRR